MRSKSFSPGEISRTVASLFGFVCFGMALPAGAQTSGAEPQSNPGQTVESEDQTSEDGGDEKSLRAKIEQLLSGYHFEPDREALDGLASADRVAKTLRTIAGDETVRPSLRSRAVSVLSLYPSEETESFLVSFLEPPSDDLSDRKRRAYEVVRLHAVTSIAELQEGAEAVETLEALLDSDDLQVRLMAITALGKYAGEAGEDRLRTLAEEVDSSELRREIEKYVDLE